MLPHPRQRMGTALSSDCRQVETFSKSPKEHGTKEGKHCTLCTSSAFSEHTPGSKSKQLYSSCRGMSQSHSWPVLSCLTKWKNTHYKRPQQSPSNQPVTKQISCHSWKHKIQRLAPHPGISIAPLLGMKEKTGKYFILSYLNSCTLPCKCKNNNKKPPTTATK